MTGRERPLTVKVTIIGQLAEGDLPYSVRFDYLPPEEPAAQLTGPVRLRRLPSAKGTHSDFDVLMKSLGGQATGPEVWLFRNRIVRVEGDDIASHEEVRVSIMHAVLKRDKAFDKMRREIELFQKFDGSAPPGRDRIPQDVQFAVWRRDEGKCARCGSQEKLEFDHIIPVIKGGNSTARNLQVLCERCNREKSDAL